MDDANSLDLTDTENQWRSGRRSQDDDNWYIIGFRYKRDYDPSDEMMPLE